MLSMCSMVGVVIGWNVDSSQRSHIVCSEAWEAAIYSAAQVDSATVDCFLDDQNMGVLLKVWTVPVVDFRSLPLAWSASTNEWRWCFDGSETGRKVRPWVGVSRR